MSAAAAREAGTVVAVLADDRVPGEAVDRAVALAQRSGSRLRIVVVPAAVPPSAAWSGWTFSPPHCLLTLKREAVERSTSIVRDAVARVPSRLPTEHQVADRSLSGVLAREASDPSVIHLFLDRRLRLRDRLTLRRGAGASLECVAGVAAVAAQL